MGFHTTRQGKRVARFRLAVVQEDGATAWHSIKAYGERAAALEEERHQGRLDAGTEVALVGYRHTRRRKTKDASKTKQMTEIYVDTLRHQ